MCYTVNGDTIIYSTLVRLPFYSMMGTIACPPWFSRVRYVGLVDSIGASQFVVIADSGSDMAVMHYDGSSWTGLGVLGWHIGVGPRFEAIDMCVKVFPNKLIYDGTDWASIDIITFTHYTWDTDFTYRPYTASYLQYFPLGASAPRFPYYRRGVGVSPWGSFMWAYAPQGSGYSTYLPGGGLSVSGVPITSIGVYSGQNDLLGPGGVLSLWSVFWWKVTA